MRLVPNMPSLGAYTIAILIALASFPVSLALTRFFMYWNTKHGIIGIDVHKLNRPKVPEMVGAAVPITLILFAAIYALTGGASSVALLGYSLVVGLTAPDSWASLSGSDLCLNPSRPPVWKLPPPGNLPSNDTRGSLCDIEYR
jgi:UDP-N-acetylmuramyl pentapeptide phosphotransferase/UDP-N-acetylglucosamine-1-phosphate transferase